MSGLIWVQTVCKDYQLRQQKLPQAGKELNTKQLVDTTFWLKPWLKFISFGSAKVLATTNSEPGKVLLSINIVVITVCTWVAYIAKNMDPDQTAPFNRKQNDSMRISYLNVECISV